MFSLLIVLSLSFSFCRVFNPFNHETRISNLLWYKLNKSSKSSQFRSWNLTMLCVFISIDHPVKYGWISCCSNNWLIVSALETFCYRKQLNCNVSPKISKQAGVTVWWRCKCSSCEHSWWYNVMPLCPLTINCVHTPDHIFRSFMINWAYWATMCVCLSLFMSVRTYTKHTHRGLRVCAKICMGSCSWLVDSCFQLKLYAKCILLYKQDMHLVVSTQILQRHFECVMLSYSQTRPSGSLDWNSNRN